LLNKLDSYKDVITQIIKVCSHESVSVLQVYKYANSSSFMNTTIFSSNFLRPQEDFGNVLTLNNCLLLFLIL